MGGYRIKRREAIVCARLGRDRVSTLDLDVVCQVLDLAHTPKVLEQIVTGADRVHPRKAENWRHSAIEALQALKSDKQDIKKTVEKLSQ